MSNLARSNDGKTAMWVYDNHEVTRARAASMRAVKERRERGCSDALKMSIDQRAVLHAMKKHGPDCWSDESFVNEVKEYNPEVVVNDKDKIIPGSLVGRIWGTRRMHNCKGGKLAEMFAARDRGEKLNLQIVVR